MADEQQGQPCECCGSLEDVVFGPDPYKSDIHDDETPCWLCAKCYTEHMHDI